jgi:ribonuclease T2
MQRGDVTVLSISTALAAVVVAALTYSVLVLDRSPSSSAADRTDSTLLVVTWGPSFCRVDPPSSICTSGEIGDMGRTLILHGMWPQPPDSQYCGVPKALVETDRHHRYTDLPPVELSEDVRTNLQSVMANSANLAAHEWYTHGTCSGVTPDEYFGDAAALTDQVRQVLDPVFESAGGGQLTLGAVRDRVDEEFGEGAGERVVLACRTGGGDTDIVENVRLSLPRVVDMNTGEDSLSLRDLLVKGPPIDAGCQSGLAP